MKTKLLLAGAATASLLLSGCATDGNTAQGSIMPAVFGHTKTVSVVDSSERIKLTRR